MIPEVASKFVAELVAKLRGKDALIEEFEFAQAALECGRFLGPAFMSALRAADDPLSIQLAGFARKLEADGIIELDDIDLSHVKRVLSSALRSQEHVLTALKIHAFTSTADVESAAQILPYAKSNFGETQLTAWIALARFLSDCQDAEGEVLEVFPGMIVNALKAYLESDSLYYVTGAAQGIGLLGAADEAVNQRLLEALGNAESLIEKQAVLSVIGTCGKGNRQVQQALSRWLETAGEDDELNWATGHALGCTTTGATYNECADSCIHLSQFHGMLFGLSAACLEDAVLRERLLTLLVSDDSFERQVACSVFSHSPALAKSVSGHLLARVGVELDSRAVDYLANALAAMPSICDELAAKMTSRNIAAMATAALALGRMGLAGAHALVRVARTTDDIEAKAAMIAVFRDIGAAKLAVAEELGHFLHPDEHNELRYFLLKALAAMGVAARAAAPEVVQAMFDEDAEIREEAEAVIRSIGPEAIPHLQARMDEAGPEEHARLEVLCGWLATYDRSIWSQLIDVELAELLGFLHVADCLKGGRLMSYRQMAVVPADPVLLRVLGREPDYSWLQRVCVRLRRSVTKGSPLVATRKQATGLTKRGRELAVQIRVFLYERGIMPRFSGP